MSTNKNEFFYDKGNNYFGQIFGCAIRYLAFEWEGSAEIEFDTLRFGFDDAEEFEWTNFDLTHLEAECLFEICRAMDTTIRVNLDGRKVEIYPSEELETVEIQIRRTMSTPIDIEYTGIKQVKHKFLNVLNKLREKCA